MFIKIFILSFVWFSFFSFEALSKNLSKDSADKNQGTLKAFKGVVTNKSRLVDGTEETEVWVEDTVKTDSFCCDRQIQTGDAHETRYNMKAFLSQTEDPKARSGPPSTGKK